MQCLSGGVALSKYLAHLFAVSVEVHQLIMLVPLVLIHNHKSPAYITSTAMPAILHIHTHFEISETYIHTSGA